jgi:hypothetical protein
LGFFNQLNNFAEGRVLSDFGRFEFEGTGFIDATGNHEVANRFFHW